MQANCSEKERAMSEEEMKVAILLSLADDHTKVVLSPEQMEIAERLMRGENDEDR